MRTEIKKVDGPLPFYVMGRVSRRKNEEFVADIGAIRKTGACQNVKVEGKKED